MYLETIVIFLTRNRHMRISRALRSVFLLDAYIMFGVRRYVNTSLYVYLHCFLELFDIYLYA